MQIEIRALSPVSVEVKATFPWDRVSQVLESRYAKLARTAKIKGFRPGKVPVKVAKQIFRGQVEQESMGDLMQEALEAAVDQHKLLLAARPEVAQPTLTQGEAFSFVATCQVRPTIDAVTLDGITVYRELDTIDDAALTEEFDRMRDARADVQVVEPARPAQAKDVLVVDYTVAVDGEARPELKAEDRTVELAEGRLLPELSAALLGASVGDVKTAEVSFPDTHQNPTLRGKKATFELTVKEIKAKLLPALDDEFAKDCGEASLEALQASVRNRLETAAKSRSDASMKDQLIEAIVEKNPLEVPPALVAEQRQQLAYELYQMSQMLGQPPPVEMTQNLDGRAERRVRAGLLLAAVARLEDLNVTDADFDARLTEMAGDSGRNVARLRAEWMKDERRAQLESQILEEKIIAHLKTKVSVVDGKRPEAAAG